MPKIPYFEGGQNLKVATRGRDYTQMKGLAWQFCVATLVLAYDVIMTSFRGFKVGKKGWFCNFITFFQKFITPRVVKIFEFS